MVCAPVRSIIPSLKLGDYVSVQAHKPCSISHFNQPSRIIFLRPQPPVLCISWKKTRLFVIAGKASAYRYG